MFARAAGEAGEPMDIESTDDCEAADPLRVGGESDGVRVGVRDRLCSRLLAFEPGTLRDLDDASND